MTNLVFLVSVITTNWVNNGDFKREGGTNYVRQTQSILTTMYVVEVQWCTNQTFYKRTESVQTNAPTRWTLSASPLPGSPSKE
jgi:hypothetical protein